MRELVNRVTRGGRAICGVILSIASSLSLDAIAEGVENEQQLRFLRESGCRYAQGYYFAHPGDPASIAAQLAAAQPGLTLPATCSDTGTHVIGSVR